MKTRKTLSHTLLVTELFNQLKFPVKVRPFSNSRYSHNRAGAGERGGETNAPLLSFIPVVCDS